MHSRALATLALTTLISCGTTSTPSATTVNLETSATHTNGTVGVYVDIRGTADKVELLLDGTSVTLGAPYTYQWDTTRSAEGPHTITARVTHGAGSSSSTRTVYVDRTPPVITARTPAANATNVFMRAPITVTFDETIKASTVTDANVQLATSGALLIGKTLALSPDARTITAQLVGTPVTPIDLSLTVTGGVTDLAGNPAVQTSWSWNLPPWLDRGVISGNHAGRQLNNMSMALDPLDLPVVAWQERDPMGGARDVYVKRWDGESWQSLGGSLSAPESSGGFAQNPAVVVDGDGTPIVAWNDFDDTAYRIYLARWVGGAWEAIGGPLYANEGSSRTGAPSLALDSEGRPVVAWTENSAEALQTNRVYVKTWSGSAWEATGGALSAGTGGSGPTASALVLDAQDNPVVAWVEIDGAVRRAYVRRWTGSAWQPVGDAVPFGDATSSVDDVSLALNADGEPVVAVQEDYGNTRHVHVQRWTGSAWQPVGSELRASDATLDAISPSLAVSPSGEIVVGWSELAGVDRRVRVHRWTGSAWQLVSGPYETLQGSGVYLPVVKLARGGSPVVGWAVAYETEPDLIYARQQNR